MMASAEGFDFSDAINALLRADLEKEQQALPGPGALSSATAPAPGGRQRRPQEGKRPKNAGEEEAMEVQRRREEEQDRAARAAEAELLALVEAERRTKKKTKTKTKKTLSKKPQRKPGRTERPGAARSSSASPSPPPSPLQAASPDASGGSVPTEAVELQRVSVQERAGDGDADVDGSKWERAATKAARKRQNRARRQREEERAAAATPQSRSGHAAVHSPSSLSARASQAAPSASAQIRSEPTATAAGSNTWVSGNAPPPLFHSSHFPSLVPSSSSSHPSRPAPPGLAATLTSSPPPPPPPPSLSAVLPPPPPSSGSSPAAPLNKGDDEAQVDPSTTDRGDPVPSQLDKTLFDAVYANMQKLKASGSGHHRHQRQELGSGVDDERAHSRQTGVSDGETRDDDEQEDEADEEDAWNEQGATDWNEEGDGEGSHGSGSEYIVGGDPQTRRRQRKTESLWGSRMTGSLWGETNEWDRSDLTIDQVLKMQARMEGVGEMSITQQLVVALNNQMNERMNDFSRQMEYIITLLVVLDTKVKHLEDKQAQFHSWWTAAYMRDRDRDTNHQRPRRQATPNADNTEDHHNHQDLLPTQNYKPAPT